MSEYQYYDFQAIDKPLNATELEYIRSLSRRVQPTPTHAVFTYSFGDFPARALDVLAKYYDAMLYLANWGTRQLVFRFPRAALDLEALKPYYFGVEMIELKTTRQHVILDIGVHPEGDGGEWIAGEGTLTGLLPLRDDLLRGDYRVLYLAWLQSVQDEEGAFDEDEDDWYADDEDEDEDTFDEEDDAFDEDKHDPAERGGQSNLREPPVPPGLGQLTPALRAFIVLFDIDADLVAAAAEASPPLTPVDEPVERWVGLLPPAERDAWLVRVARVRPGWQRAPAPAPRAWRWAQERPEYGAATQHRGDPGACRADEAPAGGAATPRGRAGPTAQARRAGQARGRGLEAGQRADRAEARRGLRPGRGAAGRSA